MAGDFNTGRDVAVTITGPNGTSVTFSILTEFDRNQRVTELKSAGLDGITRHENIPDEWTGTLHFDRASNAIDQMIYAYESGYFSGTKVAKGSILETITEVDNTISQWRYSPVVFHLGDAGRWRKDSKVEPRVQWKASRRVPAN